MRRGGGELPNNDTAPTGSWNATQSQSKSVVETWKVACKQAPKLINRGFTVFSHGIKYVVFTFGSVDKSIQMKPLGVLSHGTTYLARSSYCWSVDKIILVWPFKWNLFTQYVVLFSAGVCGILWSDHSNETSSAVLSHGPIIIGNNYQKSIFSKTICYSPHGSVHGMAANLFLWWRLSRSFLCWRFISKQITIIFFFTIITKQVNLFRWWLLGCCGLCGLET